MKINITFLAQRVIWVGNTYFLLHMKQWLFKVWWVCLPYFGKRKQVTYCLNLSYCCFHVVPTVLCLPGQGLCTNTHPPKRCVRYKDTSWYTIDVSGNDRHILLFYKKCHFCDLLPFVKLGHNYTSLTLLERFKHLWFALLQEMSLLWLASFCQTRTKLYLLTLLERFKHLWLRFRFAFNSWFNVRYYY